MSPYLYSLQFPSISWWLKHSVITGRMMSFTGRQKWLPFEPMHLRSVWLWTNYLNFLGSTDIIHKHEHGAILLLLFRGLYVRGVLKFSSQMNSFKNEIMYKIYAQKFNFGIKLKIKSLDKKTSYSWILNLKF